MQHSGEIGGVAGLDGELLEEVKLSTNSAAIEKYFRSWPTLLSVATSSASLPK